jgi:hypothetical protein
MLSKSFAPIEGPGRLHRLVSLEDPLLSRRLWSPRRRHRSWTTVASTSSETLHRALGLLHHRPPRRAKSPALGRAFSLAPQPEQREEHDNPKPLCAHGTDFEAGRRQKENDGNTKLAHVRGSSYEAQHSTR